MGISYSLRYGTASPINIFYLAEKVNSFCTDENKLLRAICFSFYHSMDTRLTVGIIIIT